MGEKVELVKELQMAVVCMCVLMVWMEGKIRKELLDQQD